ncbi:MAG: NCS2 family permease [Syntrophales bacterium]
MGLPYLLRKTTDHLRDYFDLDNNGSDVKTEIIAGLTMFLAAMYIIVVNPAILRSAGMPFNASLTATVMVSAFCCVMMGLYSNNPILVAPGMSLNVLIVSAITKVEGVSYATALGCVFYSGIIYFLLMVIDRRKRLISGVPRMLRYGLAGGIGLFIALVGLRSSGFIVGLPGGGFGLGTMNAVTITFLAGFAVTSALVVRKVEGAFIWGVLLTALFAWPIGRWWNITGAEAASVPVIVWNGVWAWPDFSLLFALDLRGAARLIHWPLISVLIFTSFFDSFSTCVGISEAGDLIDEFGDPRGLKKSLTATAVAVALSGVLGTSPATAYIESSTGVRAGGRTGLSSVVAGLLFLPFLFLSPLLALIPPLATAPVLVLAGVFMLKPLIYVRWERFDDAIPFFIAMIMMPLTESITQGVIWGILSWTIIKAAYGRFRQISWVLILLDVMALLLLFEMARIKH